MDEMDVAVINQAITESRQYALPFMRTVYGFLYQLSGVVDDIKEYQWIKSKSIKRVEGRINFRLADGSIYSFIKYDSEYLTFAFNSTLYDNPLAKLIQPDNSKYVYVHFAESRYKRNENSIDEFLRLLFPVYNSDEFNKVLKFYGLTPRPQKPTKSKSEFYDIVGDNKFQFTFTKANGEKRKALGTVNFNLVPEANRPQSNDNKKNLEDTIIYYDLEKDAWRMFKIDMLDWDSIKVIKEVVDKDKIPDSIKKRITNKTMAEKIFAIYVILKAMRNDVHFFTYGNKTNQPIGYKVSNNMTIGNDRISFKILKEIRSDGIPASSSKLNLEFDVAKCEIEINENMPTIFITTPDGLRYIFNRGNLFYKDYDILYSSFSDIWDYSSSLAHKLNTFIENKEQIKYMKSTKGKLIHTVVSKNITVVSKGKDWFLLIPIKNTMDRRGNATNERPMLLQINVKDINTKTFTIGLIEAKKDSYEFMSNYKMFTFGE